MLSNLIGRISTVSLLKQGLDESTARSRSIASRVANAGDFGQALNGANGGAAGGTATNAQGGDQVDLEAEMVSLADEQLRYSASATLLQRVYAQIRSSVRER